MTEPIEQLMASARSMRLSQAEHVRMRRMLESYAATYRPPLRAWTFIVRHASAASALAFIIAVGTTAAIAQRSSPDDTLYGVRLTVHDRVQVLLSGDQDAQVDTELRQLERMLDDEEFALADELAEVSRGIEDAADGILGGEADTGRRSSSGDAPVLFDDGADWEMESITRELEEAVQETPDMGD